MKEEIKDKINPIDKPINPPPREEVEAYFGQTFKVMGAVLKIIGILLGIITSIATVVGTIYTFVVAVISIADEKPFIEVLLNPQNIYINQHIETLLVHAVVIVILTIDSTSKIYARVYLMRVYKRLGHFAPAMNNFWFALAWLGLAYFVLTLLSDNALYLLGLLAIPTMVLVIIVTRNKYGTLYPAARPLTRAEHAIRDNFTQTIKESKEKDGWDEDTWTLKTRQAVRDYMFLFNYVPFEEHAQHIPHDDIYKIEKGIRTGRLIIGTPSINTEVLTPKQLKTYHNILKTYSSCNTYEMQTLLKY